MKVLGLGQLLMNCCANDSVMFASEDEMLMERLQKVFIEKRFALGKEEKL